MLMDARPAGQHSNGSNWCEDALCGQADPELWFPEPWEDDRAAKLICGWCPVRAACLAYALEANEEYGVWGGLSSEERRQLRRESVVPASDQGASASAVDAAVPA